MRLKITVKTASCVQNFFSFIFRYFFIFCVEEELAKRLQEEENKNRHTPSKQQAKKMRTLELDTKFTKDKQPAQLPVNSSSKSPWKKMGMSVFNFI